MTASPTAITSSSLPFFFSSRWPTNASSSIPNVPRKCPEAYNWQILVCLEAEALWHARPHLPQAPEQNPRPRQAPRRLIADLIDREQWTTLDVDVKGDAYEGLLEKNAEDVKTGAGQYFTPRALIRAIVDVMRPEPGKTIHDPACGTGRFLLAAHEYISKHYNLDKNQKKHLRYELLSGVEIVDAAARLCTMNLYLHGIGGDECPIRGVDDSLAAPPSTNY